MGWWGGGRGGEGVVKGVEDVEGRVFGVGGLLFIVDTKPRPQNDAFTFCVEGFSRQHPG